MIQSIQTLLTTTKLVMKKNNQIYPYFLAVVCSTAFFSFEYVPEKSLKLKESTKKYLKAKKKRTEALNKLKEYTKGTALYEAYLIEKKNTDKLYSNLKEVKQNDRFFNFKNIQQFLGEIGWVLGLFMYSLFNLFKSYTATNKERGYIFLHSVLLSIACFYLFWIFQPYQDIPRVWYYIMSVASGIVISYAVYLMAAYKFSDVGKLQLIIRNLFDFILVDAKENDFVKEDKKEYYEKKSVELAKNALDNE